MTTRFCPVLCCDGCHQPLAVSLDGGKTLRLLVSSELVLLVPTPTRLLVIHQLPTCVHSTVWYHPKPRQMAV
jgi:hypothetical protein